MRGVTLLSSLAFLGACGSGAAATTTSAAPPIGFVSDAGPVDSEDTADAAPADSAASAWGTCPPRHWTASAALAPMLAKSDTATTLLADGRVVVGGGEAVYDPTADKYTLTPRGARGFPLGSSQTVLADGRTVLVAGGAPDAYSSSSYAFTFDPDTLVRKPIAPMLNARAGHQAALLPNGKVMVVAGDDGSGGVPPVRVEIYDPVKDTWTQSAPPPHFMGRVDCTDCEPRSSLAQLQSGDVFVTTNFGDCESYLYRWRADAWELLAPPPPEERFIAEQSTTLRDGRVLVTGSSWCAKTSTSALSTWSATHAQSFDPVSRKWQILTPYRHDRAAGFKVVAMPCGDVLLFGATTTGLPLPLKYIERYDPSIDMWFDVSSDVAIPAASTGVVLRDGTFMLAYGDLPDAPRDGSVALFLRE